MMTPVRLSLRRGLLIACSLSLSLAAMTFAAPIAPPTDEQIQEKIAAIQKAPRSTFEAYQAKVREVLADVNVEELSLKQIGMLANLIQHDDAKSEAARTHLAKLAEAKDVDGAIAAVVAISVSMKSEQNMKDAVTAAFKHPAIVDAAKTETGSQVFRYVGYLDEADVKALSKEVLSLQAAITSDFPASALGSTIEYLSALNKLGDAVEPKTKDALRERITGIYMAAIEKAKAEETPNPKNIERLENNVAFLNGAASRGELIDHAAPAMTFLWSSGETPITGFEQYKGKVVIVDFWATWCGPCIASFPAVKEMQERYKDYDVVILGVTSLQGKHYPGDGAEAVDTEGNPQMEYDLMKEFMKAKNMTWEVAFTQENVFNPDFGVRGIPHVAIIDPEGKVQYNGLHPMAPKKEKAEKIDSLLKKAGLATPAPIVEEEAKEDANPGAAKGG